MKKIYKKVLPEYFRAVRKRTKTFELRKDDSDYEVGDILVLIEWDGEKHTGHRIVREITYILRNVPEYGLMDGYCILGIQPVGWNDVMYVPSDVIQNGENNTSIVNNGTVEITMK